MKLIKWSGRELMPQQGKKVSFLAGQRGRYMKTAFVVLLVSLSLIACNEKKPTQAELTKLEEEFDYRSALQNYKIGVNYLQSDQVLEAINHLVAAVDLDGGNFRYRHGLGLAYSLNGQLDEAIVQLKEAIVINELHSESYNLLGSIYIDLERYDEAAAALKLVIQDKSYGQPQFPYFNLGLCMVRQGRVDEAIAAFKVATQLDPEFHRAYRMLAEIYRGKQDYRRMLYYLQRAEKGFPNDTDVLFQIGLALYKLKQYDRAKDYLAQVSILFPPPAIDKPTQDMLRHIAKIQREARK